ncbi:DUF4158 domain-containing protein [Catenulispora rubra]|uniref:DUF4158 domain-containing protein n=1 Tax=Catenulispora rubra TaxID=280293 RepID=UPI00189200EC|nr:DUF4158 domain-containing protein [Catenulispora rubra]
MGRRLVGMDELVEHWTVLPDEDALLFGRHQDTKLAFALMLKFYTFHGRFPRRRFEFAEEVVEHVAAQLKLPASGFGLYNWSGRTSKEHRKQIRAHLGFRECSVADADKLAEWLAVNVAHAERDADRARGELLKKMSEERIEPPTDGRVGRVVSAALSTAEKTWFARIEARIGTEPGGRLLALVGWGELDVEQVGTEEDPYDSPESVFSRIRAAAGRVSLESMIAEMDKLLSVRAVEVPDGVFADVAPKVLAGWRVRCAVESPSHLRRRSRESAVTLLAALLHAREREITDDLTDLLIGTVHRIDARAHKKGSSPACVGQPVLINEKRRAPL